MGHFTEATSNYMILSNDQCVTPWHVDFSSTTAFYTVARGHKTFWLMEPTRENMKFYENLNSFQNLRALSGRLHKLVVEAGDIIVVPARWPHVVATKGDSIAFASNFLAVTHFPLIVNSHLNASQQEIDAEEVFPAIIQIYAVLQSKIQQLQRELKKLEKGINADSSGDSKSSPLFNPFFRDPQKVTDKHTVTLLHTLSDEQLTDWKKQVRRETQDIKRVRNFC